MAPSADGDDMDLALDGLTGGVDPAAPTPSPAAPAVAPSMIAAATQAPAAPQPLAAEATPAKPSRESVPPLEGPWQGRRALPDLAAAVTVPNLGKGAGPEEKMNHLRDKLRATEQLQDKLRLAVDIRERELDLLESELQQARQQVHAVEERLQKVEGFMEAKRLEFEAYNHKVQAAIAARDATINDLRKDLKVLSEAQQQSDKAVGIRDEAIKRLNRAVDSLETSLKDREDALSSREEQMQDQRTEIERMTLALRAEAAKRSSPSEGKRGPPAPPAEAVLGREPLIKPR